MATVGIEFETGNAAFADAYTPELSAVLHEAFIQLRDYHQGTSQYLRTMLRDSNGNTVGKVTVSE